jgi:hypothetical protein
MKTPGFISSWIPYTPRALDRKPALAAARLWRKAHRRKSPPAPPVIRARRWSKSCAFESAPGPAISKGLSVVNQALEAAQNSFLRNLKKIMNPGNKETMKTPGFISSWIPYTPRALGGKLPSVTIQCSDISPCLHSLGNTPELRPPVVVYPNCHAAGSTRICRSRLHRTTP